MDYFKRYYWVYLLTFAGIVAAALLFTRHFEQTRQVAAEQAAPPEPVVVIDPGHGGEDGGATTPGGVRESDLNLTVSLRLRDLCVLLGIRTQLLREDDVALYTSDCATISEKKSSDLRRRVELVNETPGALLVSIHQISFPDARYDGAQVFYAATEGSQALAERLQELLTTALDPDNRRVCKPSESVYLMEHIRCTAILVECGFLTNPAEAALLQTDAYQKQLACTVAAALSDYLREAGGV